MTEKIELRDWFAGQALAGISSKSSMSLDRRDGETFYEYQAQEAYAFADAMLAEREKRPPADPTGMIA